MLSKTNTESLLFSPFMCLFRIMRYFKLISHFALAVCFMTQRKRTTQRRTATGSERHFLLQHLTCLNSFHSGAGFYSWDIYHSWIYNLVTIYRFLKQTLYIFSQTHYFTARPLLHLLSLCFIRYVVTRCWISSPSSVKGGSCCGAFRERGSPSLSPGQSTLWSARWFSRWAAGQRFLCRPSPYTKLLSWPRKLRLS